MRSESTKGARGAEEAEAGVEEAGPESELLLRLPRRRNFAAWSSWAGGCGTWSKHPYYSFSSTHSALLFQVYSFGSLVPFASSTDSTSLPLKRSPGRSPLQNARLSAALIIGPGIG